MPALTAGRLFGNIGRIHFSFRPLGAIVSPIRPPRDGTNMRPMQNPLGRTTARQMLSAMALCAAMIPATAGAQATPKTYTRFLGANVAVNLDKSAYPVRDVSGSAWVVEINGEQKVISAKQGPINLKITPVMKLAEVSAVIADFKRAGAYTFANDPSVKLTRGLGQAATISAGYQAAANQANAINPTIVTVGTATGTPSGSGVGSSGGPGQGAVAAASASAGVQASADLMGKPTDDSGYDAMSVEFEVSSPKPLQNPYVVTMTRFHPPGSDPTTVQSLVFAKALDPVGPTPTKVTFTEEGFPINFSVVDFQIHLYNGGTEVATSLSEKREAMTFDQTFDYVKSLYLESHKGATMRAMPMMGDVPADFASHLVPGKYPETVYVKISKEGLADAAFSDSACEKRIEDPYLDSVLKDLRFKPALEKGAPVEGTASIKLAQLGN